MATEKVITEGDHGEGDHGALLSCIVSRSQLVVASLLDAFDAICCHRCSAVSDSQDKSNLL